MGVKKFFPAFREVELNLAAVTCHFIFVAGKFETDDTRVIHNDTMHLSICIY